MPSTGVVAQTTLLLTASNSEMSLGQLKILQEVITLAVFVPFAVLYMREPLKLDFAWAGLCLIGAVYFMFRAN